MSDSVLVGWPQQPENELRVDMSYRERWSSLALNNKFSGMLPQGVYRGFNVSVYGDGSSMEVSVGSSSDSIALVEVLDPNKPALVPALTARMPTGVLKKLSVPKGAMVYVVLKVYYKVEDDLTVEDRTRAEIEVVSTLVDSPYVGQIVLATINVPSVVSKIASSHIQNFSKNDLTKLEGKTKAEVIEEALKGKAADSLKFEGKTKAQVITETLQGKAANSYKFDGKTKTEVITEALQGTAANSSKLDGKTKTQVITEILQGTSANSSKLDGKTKSEVVTEARGGTAANSSKLENTTKAQVIAEALKGKAANSSQLEGQTKAQVIAEALKGKAADSLKLEGNTQAQVITEALKGTAANSTKFAGKTKTEIITEARGGTAADSDKLGGKTAQEFLDDALSKSDNSHFETIFNGNALSVNLPDVRGLHAVLTQYQVSNGSGGTKNVYTAATILLSSVYQNLQVLHTDIEVTIYAEIIADVLKIYQVKDGATYNIPALAVWKLT